MPGPQTAALLAYFTYDHLPPYLQPVSRPLCDVAHLMAEHLGYDHPQLLAGLQDLLRAKDCFVRAALDENTFEPLDGNAEARSANA